MSSDVAKRYRQAYLQTTGRGPIAELLAPSRAGEWAFRHWFAKCERLSRAPRANVTIYGLFQAGDVTRALAAVRAFTLILCRAADRHVREGLAELLAARIPRARLVELPGEDHLWYAGDVEAPFDSFDGIGAVLTGVRAEPSGGRG